MQWHQAFYASIQIEFANENEFLIFENDIIVHANQDAFKEVPTVCKALEDLYWEVHGERIQREQKEALDKAVDAAVAEAVA